MSNVTDLIGLGFPAAHAQAIADRYAAKAEDNRVTGPFTLKPSTTPIQYFEMDPSAAHADALSFSFNIDSTAQSGARDNIIHRFGVNIGTNGSREDTSEIGLSIEMEELWRTGGANKAEFHFNMIDTDATARRGLSFNWTRGSIAATLEASLVARVLYVVDAEDNTTFRMKCNFAGTNKSIEMVLTHGLQLSGVGASNSAVYLGQNNIGFLVQNKASSGATVVAMVDENDKILIGAAESWSEAAGVVFGTSRMEVAFGTAGAGLLFTEREAPGDPASGKAQLYVDSATGDLMVKINHGGVVKTATLADYSGL